MQLAGKLYNCEKWTAQYICTEPSVSIKQITILQRKGDVIEKSITKISFNFDRLSTYKQQISVLQTSGNIKRNQLTLIGVVGSRGCANFISSVTARNTVRHS